MGQITMDVTTTITVKGHFQIPFTNLFVWVVKPKANVTVRPHEGQVKDAPQMGDVVRPSFRDLTLASEKIIHILKGRGVKDHVIIKAGVGEVNVWAEWKREDLPEGRIIWNALTWLDLVWVVEKWSKKNVVDGKLRKGFKTWKQRREAGEFKNKMVSP